MGSRRRVFSSITFTYKARLWPSHLSCRLQSALRQVAHRLAQQIRIVVIPRRQHEARLWAKVRQHLLLSAPYSKVGVGYCPRRWVLVRKQTAPFCAHAVAYDRTAARFRIARRLRVSLWRPLSSLASMSPPTGTPSCSSRLRMQVEIITSESRSSPVLPWNLY